MFVGLSYHHSFCFVSDSYKIDTRCMHFYDAFSSAVNKLACRIEYAGFLLTTFNAYAAFHANHLECVGHLFF